MFLLRDYPRFHVEALEDLLFPGWYTACFLDDPTNAAMWGIYGDGHRGACLQFGRNSSSTSQALNFIALLELAEGETKRRFYMISEGIYSKR